MLHSELQPKTRPVILTSTFTTISSPLIWHSLLVIIPDNRIYRYLVCVSRITMKAVDFHEITGINRLSTKKDIIRASYHKMPQSWHACITRLPPLMGRHLTPPTWEGCWERLIQHLPPPPYTACVLSYCLLQSDKMWQIVACYLI